MDTVHQGDQDGVKGVYHINAVDQVTQWEVVVCAPRISEEYVKPALIALLAQFPLQLCSYKFGVILLLEWSDSSGTL